MMIPPKFCCRLLLAAVMPMVMWSCAHKPFDPPQTDEIPQGPGVFTKGDDGAVLFDSKKKSVRAADRAPGLPAAGRPGDAPMADEDYEAFEAYRQWLEWKKSNAGTEAYREFRQWQEWRRYQEWKKKK